MEILNLDSIESIGYLHPSFTREPIPFRMQKIKKCWFDETGLFVIKNKRGKLAGYSGKRIVVSYKAV